MLAETDKTNETRAGALILASPLSSSDAADSSDLLWMPLAGRPLISWSVAACMQTPAIVETVLLVAADQVAEAQALAQANVWERVPVIPAKETVRASIEHGLRALDPALPWVVIVEALRPLVTPELLLAALDLAQRTNADVITGAPVKETVKRLRDGVVVETLPRERMVRAQTPYVFSRKRLLAAHSSTPAERAFADAVTLALAAGLHPRILPAPSDHLRVASAADLAVAEQLLAARVATS